MPRSPITADRSNSPFAGKHVRHFLGKESEEYKNITPRHLHTSRGNMGYLNKINLQRSTITRDTSPKTDNNETQLLTKVTFDQSKSKHDHSVFQSVNFGSPPTSPKTAKEKVRANLEAIRRKLDLMSQPSEPISP